MDSMNKIISLEDSDSPSTVRHTFSEKPQSLDSQNTLPFHLKANQIRSIQAIARNYIDSNPAKTLEKERTQLTEKPPVKRTTKEIVTAYMNKLKEKLSEDNDIKITPAILHNILDTGVSKQTNLRVYYVNKKKKHFSEFDITTQRKLQAINHYIFDNKIRYEQKTKTLTP